MIKILFDQSSGALLHVSAISLLWYYLLPYFAHPHTLTYFSHPHYLNFSSFLSSHQYLCLPCYIVTSQSSPPLTTFPSCPSLHSAHWLFMLGRGREEGEVVRVSETVRLRVVERGQGVRGRKRERGAKGKRVRREVRGKQGWMWGWWKGSKGYPSKDIALTVKREGQASELW